MGLRPRDHARGLGLSLRTVQRELRGDGLPSPQRVLSLALVLRMAWMLQAPEHTLDTVASALGLSAVVVAGRILRREGFTVHGVRVPGGLDMVRGHVLRRLNGSE